MSGRYLARIAKLENMAAQLGQSLVSRPASSTSAPYSNYRLAKAVAGDSAYPTTGRTFYIDMLDGEYSRALGATSGTFNNRHSSSGKFMCFNLNNVLPPEGEFLLVFEHHGYWYTQWGIGQQIDWDTGSAQPVQLNSDSNLVLSGVGYEFDNGQDPAITLPYSVELNTYNYSDYAAWVTFNDSWFVLEPLNVQRRTGQQGFSYSMDFLDPDRETYALNGFNSLILKFQGTSAQAHEGYWTPINPAMNQFGFWTDRKVPEAPEAAMDFHIYASIGAPTINESYSGDNTDPGYYPVPNPAGLDPWVFGPINWNNVNNWSSSYNGIGGDPNVTTPDLASLANQVINSTPWTGQAPGGGAADSRVITFYFIPTGTGETGAADLGADWFYTLPLDPFQGVNPRPVPLFGTADFDKYLNGASPVGKTVGAPEAFDPSTGSSVGYGNIYWDYT